jgi:hypothetical protein
MIGLLVRQGNPRVRYAIEATTNLVTWERLGAATKIDGRIHFIGTTAGSHSLRVYRAISP